MKGIRVSLMKHPKFEINAFEKLVVSSNSEILLLGEIK